MVWAITIICLTLSCGPIPQLVGWYDTDEECAQAAIMISQSWKPDIGFYSILCRTRLVV